MRSTSCTPSSTSSSRGSPSRLPPTAPITVRSAPVERCTSNPISTSCEMTRCTCSSVARSCMTTTMIALHFDAGLKACATYPNSSFYRPVCDPLETPGLVDDPLEQPFDGAVVQRSAVDPLHVVEHLRLPS